LLALFNVNFPNKTLFLTLSLVTMTVGIIGFSYGSYAGKHEGLKNDGGRFLMSTSQIRPCF